MGAGPIVFDGIDAERPTERKMRCMRCGEVVPESRLGAHRRMHHGTGTYGIDWTSAEAEEQVEV